jgi:peptidoglycan/LPS O-acetylase OafA/YrhL
MPALDGLRGLAVLAVVGYHLGVPGTAGGYLGVDLFFVLSGFLITGILVGEPAGAGSLALRRFWGRRARRLLPALLLLLVAVAAAAAAGLLVGVPDLGALRADALATLGYVANWHQLLAGQSYFARLAAPSPLAHTWSLAIEEQFYVVWPLVVAAALWALARRHDRDSPTRRHLPALATAAAAVTSAAWMGWLAAHGASADRVYYGTDTRAFELLAGSALAFVLAGRARPGRTGRAVLHTAAGAGLGAVVAFVTVVGSGAVTAGAPPSRWMFEGGMALFAAAAVFVVAGAGWTNSGPVAVLLRVAPLRVLGRVSYALYLWHWPVVTQLTAARTGLGGAELASLRLAVALVLAVASTFLVEEPIRRRAGAGTGASGPAASRRSNPFPARRRPWVPAPGPVAAAGAVAAAALTVVVATAPVDVAAATTTGPPPQPGAVVPGSGGLSSQPRLVLGATPPSPKAPLRVTLVGDSVMRVQAPAVVAALRATGAAVVSDMAYPGWGLSTDHHWPSAVPAMLERTRPQLVVATWSWDGDWLLSDPRGYRAALERFVGLLLDPPGGAPGAGAVALEEFPPLGPFPGVDDASPSAARRVEGVRAWNALAATMPARFPGRVLYLPLGGAVERAGRYATWLRQGRSGPWVRVRSVDATHFCPAGAARYSAALLADLRLELHLPAARPGWWSGTWHRDSVFRTPPGVCPGDRPGAAGSG